MVCSWRAMTSPVRQRLKGGGGVRDRGCAAAVQGGGLVEDDDPVC
jgi:hypothetical protein